MSYLNKGQWASDKVAGNLSLYTHGNLSIFCLDWNWWEESSNQYKSKYFDYLNYFIITLTNYCQTPVQSDSTVQVSRTRSLLCFPPVTRTSNNPHQNLPAGSVLQTWNLAPRLNSQNQDQVMCYRWSVTILRMVTNHSKDGHQPFQGWSPTIQNLPLGSVLQTLNLAHNIDSQNQDQVNCHGWSATIPRMVTHHPKDVRPPSKINQKELYYTLGIWHLYLTHKI